MANDLLPYRPLAGVNREVAAPAIAEMECEDSLNFLFERGMVITRDGVEQLAITGLTGNITHADSKRYGTTPYTVLLTDAPKLFKLVGVAAAELTGVVPVFGDSSYHNIEVVNGVVLIANCTGGLIRWDPSGTVCTQLATAKYRYVTSHLSRAVAAYNTSTSALLGPRTVGWSVVGDETDWASAGSGSTVLSDAVDDITGLGVIHNVVVILRRAGKHLGYPTGTSTPAFRFENYTRDGNGCYYPGTAAYDNNIAYYVGVDDVYAFNLLEDAPIGRNIRRELLERLRAGYSYKGFVSRVSGSRPKHRYHLVNTTGGSGCPHFIYDIEEGAWSKHTYDAMVPLGGWSHIVSTSQEYTTLYRNTSLLRWNESAALDTPASLNSGVLTVGSLGSDMQLSRVLLRYQDLGASQVTLHARAEGIGIETSIGLAARSDLAWNRRWADFRLNGQSFQLRLETSERFAFDYLGLQLAEGGVHRDA